LVYLPLPIQKLIYTDNLYSLGPWKIIILPVCCFFVCHCNIHSVKMCIVINAFIRGIKKGIWELYWKKGFEEVNKFFLTKTVRTKYILGENFTLPDFYLHYKSMKSDKVHIGSGMLFDGYIYDMKKIMGFSLQTIQPVMSCCTDHATLAAYRRR